MNLGQRIATWRKAKGLSPQDLAKAVGVTPAAVYQWEYPKGGTVPRTKTLTAIIDALGITMAEFYGPTPKTKKGAA